MPGASRPLRIGLSARLMHRPPAELGFRGKTLQYLEQSVAHWILAHGVVTVMVPTLGFDAEVARRRISVREYVELLDGLVLQGGADVSPTTYGRQPLRAEWAGDLARDRYEIELIEGFMQEGKPVLGICRGCQLLNVAFGGTLVQDLPTQRPSPVVHYDAELYDECGHTVRFEPGGHLAALYDGDIVPWVTSIHHQAVDRLGGDLVVEARATDGLVEAIRLRGGADVLGVQWHPEFHGARPDRLDPEPMMSHWLAAARARSQQ